MSSLGKADICTVCPVHFCKGGKNNFLRERRKKFLSFLIKEKYSCEKWKPYNNTQSRHTSHALQENEMMGYSKNTWHSDGGWGVDKVLC